MMKKIMVILLCMVVCLMVVTACAESAIVDTESGTLNMRKSAKKDSIVIIKIPKGKTVEVLEKGDWSLVEYKGKKGYVNSIYLLFDGKNESDAVLDVGLTESTYNTMMNLTKYDCTKNPLGMYEYEGQVLLSQDCEWIDNPRNKKGTVECGAIYRKMAVCLEAFEIGNNWKGYAPIILGYTPNSRDDFAKVVKNLSSFIVREKPAEKILSKLKTISNASVKSGKDAQNRNTYIIKISNLSNCAQELNISEEMLGHIFCALYEYGSSVVFNGNSCVIEYTDYSQK